MRAVNWALIVAPLALSACATNPIPTSEALNVPNARIYEPSLTTPSAKTGIVTVKRDSGFGGSACNTKIFSDGQLVAELEPSEKVVLYLSVGNHIISAWPNNPCGGGMVEADANVKSEKPLTYRVGYGSNGDFGLYPTAF